MLIWVVQTKGNIHVREIKRSKVSGPEAPDYKLENYAKKIN